MKIIGDIWPGNEIIDEWLTAYENGTANVPTQEQIDHADRLGFANKRFGALATPAHQPSGARASISAHWRRASTKCGRTSASSAPASSIRRAGSRRPPGPSTSCWTSEKVSQRTLPLETPNLITVNLDAAPAAPDSQVTKDVSTQAQQDVQSITPAATGAPADAAAVPNNTDTEAGQTLATDTTRDGNMSVPGKVGGNGTKSRGLLRDALRSAGEQISSSISKVTGGLTGGTKSDNTGGTGNTDNTGGTTPGNTGATGGKHRAE